MGLTRKYLHGIYRTAMDAAYDHAIEAVLANKIPGWRVLDCGAGNGRIFETLNARGGVEPEAYSGVEWSPAEAEEGRARGLDIIRGDLNRPLPHGDASFDCVYALSVLEHLLNGCAWMQEAKRVLKPGGRLVILTPNIATYFTAALLLAGRMPSTGPHPDSNVLMERVSMELKDVRIDAEGETPTRRHLVVFSYRALRDYLGMIGMDRITGRGFGLYPAPNFLQPLLQRLDPWHCHQMVFTAHKPA